MPFAQSGERRWICCRRRRHSLACNSVSPKRVEIVVDLADAPTGHFVLQVFDDGSNGGGRVCGGQGPLMTILGPGRAGRASTAVARSRRS